MARVVIAKVSKGQWSAYARNLRNYATFRYAQEFHTTAQKTGSPVVRAYLLGHAIELYLKAFLLKAGLSSTDLKSKRKYGHNLEKLLAEAKVRDIEKFVRISPQMEDDLAKLNALYPETLRHFSLLHLLKQPHLPPLARLFRLAASFSKRLERHVAV
jgi:hypothetical protein